MKKFFGSWCFSFIVISILLNGYVIYNWVDIFPRANEGFCAYYGISNVILIIAAFISGLILITEE